MALDKEKLYDILSACLLVLSLALFAVGLGFWVMQERLSGALFVLVGVIWLKSAMMWARMALLEATKRRQP